MRRRAEHKDHVWCVDFIHDRDDHARPLKWLSVIDEFTRECVTLEVERGMTSEGVATRLIDAFMIHCVPTHIRSDNGGEFIARAITRLAEITGVEMLYIAPGSPWENGYAESFHGRLRDQLLNAEVFDGLHDAKTLAAKWREEYNHRRPHSSLGYLPLAVYSSRLQASAAATSTSREDGVHTDAAQTGGSVKTGRQQNGNKKDGSHLVGTPPPRAYQALCNLPFDGSNQAAANPAPARIPSTNSHSTWYRKWGQVTSTLQACSAHPRSAGTAESRLVEAQPGTIDRFTKGSSSGRSDRRVVVKSRHDKTWHDLSQKKKKRAKGLEPSTYTLAT